MLTTLKLGDASILGRCLAGEIVVVKRFLQQLRLETPIADAIRGAVQRVVSADVAAAVDARGYRRIHELLTLGQLRSTIKRAEWNLNSVAGSLTSVVFGQGLGLHSPIWVMRKPLVRFQVPFDVAQSEGTVDKAMVGKYAIGRLAALRPHRDSWYAEPTDCVNIWIALSDVQRGNGVSFYPETDGQDLRYQPDAGVSIDQRVGSPLNFELERGDLLAFHAEQLHASVLNRTAETRAVLSLRAGLSNPSSIAKEPWRYMRVNPASRISCARLHPAYSEITRRLCAARTLARRAWLGRPSSIANPGVRTAVVSPSHLPAEPNRAISNEELEQLEQDKPLAISAARCVAKTKSAGVVTFRRYCPHQGADLSFGSVDGDHIVCPWHNLPFDLKSGRSPCKTIGDISARPISIRDGEVQLDPVETD